MNDQVPGAFGLPKRNNSLTDEAYCDLRWRILSGRIAPGVLLTEADACAMTGLGKAPVRAALSELRHDRLIDIVPRRGFIVRPWLPAEAEQLHAARLLIEPSICAEAAAQISNADLRTLEDILAEADRALAHDCLAELALWDHAFHVTIARASRNDVYAEMVSRLKNRSHHQWHVMSDVPGFGTQKLAEHRTIWQALRSGDPAQARDAMTRHLAG